MSDPYAATPAQVMALWIVADAAKTMMGFWAGFAKRGSHRKEAFAAIGKLGLALDALDALRPESSGPHEIVLIAPPSKADVKAVDEWLGQRIAEGIYE